MAFKKKKKNDREAMDEALSVPVLQLGDEVPEVTCDSTMGMFNLHDVVDGAFSVIVTFLFPFDPVGTTELALLAKLKDEFDQRDAKLVALCVDTKENHRKWIEDVQELQEVVVWFPIIADENAEISRLLNLVKPMAVNAKRNLKPATLVMILDIDKRIRLIQHYPNACGRNFYETLRVLDTLKLTLFHQCVSPANWQQGKEVYVRPGLSSDAANPLFPRGFNEMRPWMRSTTQPDSDTAS